MGLFKRNYGINQEEDRELRNNLAELECEESIIKDKRDFGRVRNSMMKVLRAKYGYGMANRSLSRVNKRFSEGYFRTKKSNRTESLFRDSRI